MRQGKNDLHTGNLRENRRGVCRQMGVMYIRSSRGSNAKKKKKPKRETLPTENLPKRRRRIYKCMLKRVESPRSLSDLCDAVVSVCLPCARMCVRARVRLCVCCFLTAGQTSASLSSQIPCFSSRSPHLLFLLFPILSSLRPCTIALGMHVRMSLFGFFFFYSLCSLLSLSRFSVFFSFFFGFL